jgi:hypothetical protein
MVVGKVGNAFIINITIKFMNINKKYFAISLVTLITVAGVSLGALSMAQTVTSLTCSSNAASVAINQSVILTAMGGNGTYSWSGPNLTVTNGGGSQFAVSYSSAGTYPITVSSAGQTATCTVNVGGTVSTNALTCFPATQNVALGQTASVSATGGDGNYTWSSPDLSIANPSGSGFSASYSSVGTKTLTVSSGGLVTTCAVNVIANGTITPVTPGLPNTGGGFGM